MYTYALLNYYLDTYVLRHYSAVTFHLRVLLRLSLPGMTS